MTPRNQYFGTGLFRLAKLSIFLACLLAAVALTYGAPRRAKDAKASAPGNSDISDVPQIVNQYEVWGQRDCPPCKPLQESILDRGAGLFMWKRSLLPPAVQSFPTCLFKGAVIPRDEFVRMVKPGQIVYYYVYVAE